MRYSLFGEGEGVHSDCEDGLWASVLQHEVIDASVSARKRGVRPGQSEAAAQALVPGLQICAKRDGPTAVMQRVWQTLWSHTPWVQTVSDDSFWLQLPGTAPPLRETSALLQSLDERIGEERRFRVGLAENPFLARALVAWSRTERVPGALYRRVGRQQWLLSPGVTAATGAPATGSPPAPESAWLRRMPVRALWLLPQGVRTALVRLGVERLQDIDSIPQSELTRHFGKESLLWRQLAVQTPGGRLRVNYPPLDCREVWHAPVGEPVPAEALGSVLETLVQSVSTALGRSGTGALKVGFTWCSDAGNGRFERVSKRPLMQPESLLVQLSAGLSQCRGRTLECVEVFAEELRPLTAMQASFVVRGGMLLAASRSGRDDLRKVVQQVNHKFPRSLSLGVQPQFRELRLHVISASAASAVPAWTTG